MTARGIARGAVGCAVSLAIALATLEIGLRAAPAAIPQNLLKRFERSLRLAIAQRLGLPNEAQTYVLERDDDGPPVQLFHPHERIRFEFEDTGESGEMAMDGLGFCEGPGDDFARAAIPLLAIGDSFTVCYPPKPELTWPSVLGRLLATPAYNLGRGGVGPYEYVQILVRFGLAKRPRVVVMQVYEGNDLRDALFHQRWLAASPAERARFPERASLETFRVDPAPALANPLGRASYAFDFAVVGGAFALSKALDALDADPRAKVDFRYRLRFPDGAIVPMNVRNTDRDEVRVARELRAGTVSLSALDGAFLRFARLSVQRGFTPIVSYAPSAHTAYADFVEFADPELKALLAELSAAQREHLRALCTRLGVRFLDLTPALREAARARGARELLYYPINVHYTPAGHAVAAAAVAEVIRALPPGLGLAADPARVEAASARP